MHLCTYQSIHPSGHLPNHNPPAYTSIHPLVHLSVHLPSHPFFAYCLLHAEPCALRCETVRVAAVSRLPTISRVVWSGQGSKVRPLLSSGHQVHCHPGPGPTSPQPRFSAPPFLPVEWPGLLWVAVEGPRVRVRPAAPTAAVTRFISVFVFA